MMDANDENDKQELSPGWRNMMKRFFNIMLQLVIFLALSLVLAACSGGGEGASQPYAQDGSNVSTGAGLVQGPLDASKGDGPLDKSVEDEDVAVAGDPLAAGNPRMDGPAASGPSSGLRPGVEKPLAGGGPLTVKGPLGDEPVGGGPLRRQGTVGNQ